MISAETLLAAAISEPGVMERIGEALTSDLVMPNTFQRRIAQHAAEFYAEHGELPKEGDWNGWIGELPEKQRQGVLDQYQRLQKQDLEGYTLDSLAMAAAEALPQAAVQTARHRLLEMGDDVAPDVLRGLAARVEGVQARVEGDFSHLSWPDRPVALSQDAPTAFPVDVLPSWMREQVVNVADHTQTPTDLPLLLGLSALSTLAANKATVTIREGYDEPSLIWTATVMPSGTRKSPVFKHVVDRHILTIEEDMAQRSADQRGLAESQRTELEKALSKLDKQAAEVHTNLTLSDAERREELEELDEHRRRIREQLRDIGSSSPPRLAVSGDVTSERLPQIMGENNGRIAALAPEAGDLFRILSGQYGETPMLGIWKRGWTGDERARDDRVGREGSYVRRPAITMGVAFQPEVLEELNETRTLRGEGLLARPLYAMPETEVGWRKTGAEVPDLDWEADQRWDDGLRQLHRSEARGEDEAGDWVPHALELSDEARDVFFAFEAEVEEMLRPGGRLEHVRDWGSKLHGQAARVALLLHAAYRIEQEEALVWDPSVPLSGRAMRGGAAIARAAIPHALSVFDVVELDPKVRLGRYVVRRLEELTEDHGAPPTQSEVQQAVRGKSGLETAGKLKRVLRLLEEHNWVQTIRRPSPGKGRAPSPWVVLHPEMPS